MAHRLLFRDPTTPPVSGGVLKTNSKR